MADMFRVGACVGGGAGALLIAACPIHATGEKRLPVELVLARGEDVQDSALNWVRESARDARVTLYSKGRPAAVELKDVLTEVPLPNVGQEVHAFLHHIVKNYDSLAEKTVFMPGATPSQGFSGFQRGSASLLPGVEIRDYIVTDAAPLFVPTMAMAPDLQQMSVRMAYMDSTAEKGQPDGRKFSMCSTAGKTGWSPLLPNKFAHAVLEPLMKAQKASNSLTEFWAKHLPDVPMPEMLMFAHSTAQSISRAQVRSHPKAFYENLLAEVSSEKRPYQAYFIEYMWWYIFHGEEKLCPTDLPVSGEQARRTLQDLSGSGEQARRALDEVSPAAAYSTGGVSVLEPKTGSRLSFGSVVKVSWVSTVHSLMRVELYRFGNFETVLAVLYNGNSFNWPITPGPSGLTARPDKALKPWAANNISANFPQTGIGFVTQPGAWRTNYLLTPNDKYTIRVCPDSWHGAGTDSGHCDSDGYASSGEFDLISSIDVTSPPSGMLMSAASHTNPNATLANMEVAYNAFGYIPVTWAGYYVDASTITIRLIDAVTGYTVLKATPSNTGNYGMYVPPDTPSGKYLVEITASCESCSYSQNRYMGSHAPGGYSTAMGRSGIFDIVGHTSPPPSPPPLPGPPVAQAPFELPIIKAFQAQFGTGEITSVSGVNHDYSATSTTSSGVQNNNCEYVCRVHNVVNGRRLLFGGLQYASGTQAVGCTPAQVACNCCTAGR